MVSEPPMAGQQGGRFPVQCPVKLEMRRGRKLMKEFTELKNLRIGMKIREPSFSFLVPLSGSWFCCSFGEE